jgi:hypothetical protein
MPIFKTNKNIFEDFGEHYDANWMDQDRITLPETSTWDGSRELDPQEVELWEVLSEFSGGGVYAAWKPYGPLYMFVLPQWAGGVKSFYGESAEAEVREYAKEKNITLPSHQPNPAYAKIVITEEGMKYL